MDVAHALESDRTEGAVLGGEAPLVTLHGGALAQHQGSDPLRVAERKHTHLHSHNLGFRVYLGFRVLPQART